MVNCKEVEVALKNNHDMESMAADYGISVEELESDLHRIYHEDTYKKIKRRFKRNEKKRHKIESEVETQSEVVSIVDTTEVSDAVELCSDSLDEIEKDIKEKESELNKLEIQHQEAMSIRNQLQSRFQFRYDELLKLQNKVRQIKIELDNWTTEFDLQEVKMKELTSKIAEVRESIGLLESKKEKMTNLSIFVYSDGRVEVNNEPVKSFPDTWQQIYHDFYGNDVLDSLTGFEQKQLAKVLAKLKDLLVGRKIDVIFESNDMQAAFEELKGGILS